MNVIASWDNSCWKMSIAGIYTYEMLICYTWITHIYTHIYCYKISTKIVYLSIIYHSIYVYVCMCVDMYIHMYICVYICIFIYTSFKMHQSYILRSEWLNDFVIVQTSQNALTQTSVISSNHSLQVASWSNQ